MEKTGEHVTATVGEEAGKDVECELVSVHGVTRAINRRSIRNERSAQNGLWCHFAGNQLSEIDLPPRCTDCIVLVHTDIYTRAYRISVVGMFSCFMSDILLPVLTVAAWICRVIGTAMYEYVPGMKRSYSDAPSTILHRTSSI